MSEAILSKWVHAKNNSGVSDSDLLKILDQAALNFGERCLNSYWRLYKENPKAFLDSFIKYDSVKMACEYVNKFGRKEGILKEIEGKKDFSEWANKQKISNKWKPILATTLLLIWWMDQPDI